MQRLAEQSEKNLPREYDAIFLKRKNIGVDSQDLRRWKLLLKYFKGGRLIDMGCLDSLVGELALHKYPQSQIVGIDLAEEAIRQMNVIYESRISYKVMDVYETVYRDGYFDYVVAGELIEHLEHPQKFLKEGFRILKPGGVLALSTPKEEHIEPGAVDGERHLWSFSKKSLQGLLSQFGEVKLKTIGSEFFPKYKYHFPSLIAFTKKYG